MASNIQNFNFFKFFYYYVLHGITFIIYLCNEHLLALTYIMRNIVLYIAISAATLTVSMPVNAQKPAIELLPFGSQVQHPEALVDTIYPGEYLNWQDSIADSSVYQQNTVHLYKKEGEPRKRPGWHFKAFQSKREAKITEKKSNTETRIHFLSSIRPVRLFFEITALK